MNLSILAILGAAILLQAGCLIGMLSRGGALPSLVKPAIIVVGVTTLLAAGAWQTSIAASIATRLTGAILCLSH